MTETIRDLLIDEMQDLYDAEKQLVKALPKMVKAASSQELSEAFAGHLEQTKGHVQRLVQAFQMLNQKPKNKACAAMKGLITEAQERIEANSEGALADSSLICAAQKVEHYEIAGYGTLKAWAEELGLDDVASLLNETLREEKEADEKLTAIAGKVMSVEEMSESRSTR
ncbi:MAG: ferritin-like domain-containing protein [Acidobacteriota bacterium]|nr:ferritin-like domain-containing protein [Acidobacteriota bacterium]